MQTHTHTCNSWKYDVRRARRATATSRVIKRKKNIQVLRTRSGLSPGRKDYALPGRPYLKCTRRHNKSEQRALGNGSDESFPIATKNPRETRNVTALWTLRLALFPTRKMFPRRDARPSRKKRSNLFRYFKPLLLWSILRKWNSRESSRALNLTVFASQKGWERGEGGGKEGGKDSTLWNYKHNGFHRRWCTRDSYFDGVKKRRS